MGQRAFPAVKKRKAFCRNCAKGLESVGLRPRSEGLWTANGSELSSTHLFPQWKSGGKINIEHFPNNVMFEQSQSYLANMAPGVENCNNLHTIFPTNAAGGREQWREEIFTFLSTFFFLAQRGVLCQGVGWEWTSFFWKVLSEKNKRENLKHIIETNSFK